MKRSSGDQTVHICEGNTETISCTDPQTYITVTFASYGRTSTQVCIDTTLPTNNVGCHSDVTEEVRISCADRNSCGLEASNDKFGDSCPGYYKYLEVTYQCITGELCLEKTCSFFVFAKTKMQTSCAVTIFCADLHVCFYCIDFTIPLQLLAVCAQCSLV